MSGLSLKPARTLSATLVGATSGIRLTLTDKAASNAITVAMRAVFKGDKGDPGEYEGEVAEVTPDPLLLFENALI